MVHLRNGNKEQTDSDQRSRRGGDQGKEYEGSSQVTCIKDPWTWTTGWRLTVGVGRWAGWGRTMGGKIGTTITEQQ